MTKKNLIIVICLLTVIDLVAAGWYMSRRIEAGGTQSLFDQRDSTDVVTEADTLVTTFQDDVFDELQHNTYYYIANTPSISGDNSTRYTSIKHVKVRWPLKVNGDSCFDELNKELINKAFGNNQAHMKDARFVYLNKPSFNKPIDDEYTKLSSAPTIVPVYGNVSQVLVYPYMTSQRLLVMEIDKVEYNGSANIESKYFVHYDRQRQRLLSRLEILTADVDKENKLLKLINKKIDELNKYRGDDSKLQHALNVPAEICCGKKGVKFEYRQGTISTSPIEVMIDYDRLEDFFTEDFKQLVKENEGIKVFDDNIKPEPLNGSSAKKTTAATTTEVKKTKKTSTANSYYNSQYVKPKQKSRKKYSGAKRKSGYPGYTGKRSWNRRRR
ncbi:MAG: hypothetical protein IKW85_01155 [Muribaculaceae bacterium]|nr:hypothetical protein [Muribaculaceae bacterium]